MEPTDTDGPPAKLRDKQDRATRFALVSSAITSVEVVGGTLTGVGVGYAATGGAWLIALGLGTVATGAGVGTWFRERNGGV